MFRRSQAHVYFPEALTELLPFYSNTQIKSLSSPCKRYIIVFIIGISLWLVLLLFFCVLIWIMPARRVDGPAHTHTCSQSREMTRGGDARPAEKSERDWMEPRWIATTNTRAHAHNSFARRKLCIYCRVTTQTQHTTARRCGALAWRLAWRSVCNEWNFERTRRRYAIVIFVLYDVNIYFRVSA